MEGHPQDEAAAEGGGLSTRSVELFFGLFMLAIGGIVILDSVRLGYGWASDGPESGYFPFLTGVALALSGTWISAMALVRWKAMAGNTFVSWQALKPVLHMLLPTVAFVIAIAFLGLYVSAAIFITAFMMWQGRYGILRAATVGVSIPVILFLLFEVWFLVPLPKGPLERMLGY